MREFGLICARNRQFLVFAIGAGLVLIGAAALFAWMADAVILTRLLPGIERMAPNTALAFVFAGAWVALAAAGPGHTALVVLGGLVSALAAIVLVQYLTGVQAPGGVLQILLNTRAENFAAGAFNGRMALGTAFALSLSGAAMLMQTTMRSKAGSVAVVLCIFCAGFIGMLGVISNIVDFDILLLQSGYAHMSLYAALCMVALSVALWSLSYQQAYTYLAPANEARRIVFIAASILLFTTLLAGLLLFSITENHAVEELQRGLVRTLNDRSAILQRGIANALTEADAVAGRRPLFRKRLLALAEGRASAQTQREIGEVLDNVMSGSTISALRLLDAGGALIGARGALVEHPVLSVPLHGAGQAVLLWDKGYVLRTQLSIIEQGRKLGSIIVEIPLLTVTDALADFYGLGESGETLVCAPHTAGWMQCFPSRHTPYITQRQRVSDGMPLPMDFSLAGQKGVVAALDYRKQRVIAAYAPVGELGLGQVLKIDQAEFYQPVRERIGYVLPVLAVVLALGILLIRWQVAPLVRATVNARNRFKATLDNIAEGIVTFTEQGRVISLNPAAASMFGYTQEEMRVSNINTILPGLDITPMNIGELAGRHKNGSKFIMETMVSEVVLDGRRAHIAVVRDVTERKLAHELLWQQVQIIEQADDAIFSLNLQGIIVSWNRGAEAMFGYPKKQVFGKPVELICSQAVCSDGGCQSCTDGMFGSLTSHGGGAVEAMLRRASGETFHARLCLSILKDEGGERTGMVGYVIDISQRKQAEQALRESKEKFRTLVESTVDWVWEIDGYGMYTYSSPQVSQILGYAPAEMIGKTPLDFMPPEEAKRFGNIFAGIVAKKLPIHQLENVNLHKDGRLIVLETSGMPIFDDAGDFRGYHGVDRDITERKQAELELMQSREQLQNLSAHLQTVREEEKARIAREIHDELGSTLAALKMDVFWLSRQLPDEQIKLIAKTLSMTQLIDNAVQATRRITTELRPTILDDLGLLAAIEWQATEFQSRFDVTCEVLGDAAGEQLDEPVSIALFRIFQEALTNVVRYAHATRVTVTLNINAERIEMIVRDNGCGINEARILNPTSHGIRGMLERARQLGGSVDVRGETGHGTVISVLIPRGVQS